MGLEQVVTVGGRRIRLTNLDKVLYPETGTTKGDVLAYYSEIAAVMIPHTRDRPATRKRWVHGVGTADDPGQMFFQKNLDASTPEWIVRRSIQHKQHTTEYPLVGDLATLVWLAQMAALEIHVPQWQFGRTGVQRNPDRLVLDLDPGPGVGLRECATVAALARDILSQMGLEPMPVTSGSKGIHLYAALDGRQSSEQVSAVTRELARALEADHPELIVSDMVKSLRSRKVLVDWSQNNANKTTVAPYSLRGRMQPTVAAPRTWRELSSPALAQLDFREVLRRVARRGDPLADILGGPFPALEPTSERMAGFDRLDKYRSMRDDRKTSEPMGVTTADGAPAGQSFVIQEHHARRLHCDFRLEHDGVLVSWALPKGVPTDPAQNHLAVQTEDHPLEYGSFEGSIPGGQYGAGEVRIWDAGWFELEKWRDGREVIVVVHGEKHPPARYALIHTGHEGNTWLIHLMQPSGKSGRAAANAAGSDVADARAAADAGAGSGSGSGSDADTDTDADADGSAAAAAGEDADAAVSDGGTPSVFEPRSRRWIVGSARPRASSIFPMLATLASADDLERCRDGGSGWAYEMKWDGIRALVHVNDGSVRVVSRNGIDLTGSYPELADVADSIAGNAVLDGEIVALGRTGRPDFGRLQTRMNLTRAADVAAAMRATPVHFVAFDVLVVDRVEGPATSLLTRRYDERRDILQSIASDGGTLQVPPAFDGDLAAAIASSRELGLEGVMAKRVNSTYAAGRRSRAWLKIKHHRTQEVIIGGWRPGKGRRAGGVGSLLLGIPDADGLRYVGRVGTGFDDRELASLVVRLERLERTTTPFEDVPREDAADARWVTPKLVGEVEFAEWTATGRLRQPSWRGWRPDKSSADVAEERA